MRIVVALIRNSLGQVLLVRKRGTYAFMQPGGKVESGESLRSALTRELKEELALDIAVDRLDYLGEASAPAGNEVGVTVDATIFGSPFEGELQVQAEIEEAVWVDPQRPGSLNLAPLTRDHILPLAS